MMTHIQTVILTIGRSLNHFKISKLVSKSILKFKQVQIRDRWVKTEITVLWRCLWLSPLCKMSNFILASKQWWQKGWQYIFPVAADTLCHPLELPLLQFESSFVLEAFSLFTFKFSPFAWNQIFWWDITLSSINGHKLTKRHELFIKEISGIISSMSLRLYDRVKMNWHCWKVKSSGELWAEALCDCGESI